MENNGQACEAGFRLKFVGKMTYESYWEQEDRVIDTMRRHKSLEIDLGEVSEIDLCGLHLVGLLHRVGVIVASSPVIEQAARRLLVSHNSAALGHQARRDTGSHRRADEATLR